MRSPADLQDHFRSPSIVMRLSNLFGETLRAAPGDVEVESHRLLLRAGFIRQLASGIFSYLPLGLRAIRKIENILREEMDAIGGQEIVMPVVHPADPWKETGRWYQIGDEMARFHDRAGREMLLAMTHEEIVTDLARREINSYRQLPQLVYQLQTKFRDEPRPRAGLLRVREFTMKDSYSFDADAEGLELQYRRHYTSYFRMFDRAGLPDVIAVGSDTGMMGGKMAHEFMFLTPIGEDVLATCAACGYASNLQVARFRKPAAPDEPPADVEPVETPGASTIEAVADHLGIPTSRTAKAVFYTAQLAAEEGDESAEVRDVFVLALVRGDMQVNETKLANAIGSRGLRPATAEEIRAAGVEPGYGSPVGAAETALVVVDDLLPESPNLVMGANRAGWHLRNVNVGRDFAPGIVADVVSAYEGAECPECGEPLALVRGVEVGNIFQLGVRYSEAMGATFLDANGREQPLVMGSYGIGVGRMLACLAESHHDDRGLTLPISVAPYQAHLVRLSADEEVVRTADELYDALRAAGVEVLYDDRASSAGVKFADADLIGAPFRLTLSSRSLKAGGVEYKERKGEGSSIVPVAEVVDHLREQVEAARSTLAGLVRDVPWPE
jgi:prolyl-tRNA synthetase